MDLSKPSINNTIIACGIAVMLYLIVCEIDVLHQHFIGDFADFYYGAQALVTGNHLYQSGYGGYIYPPFFAFLIIPLTAYSSQTSCIVWQAVNLTLLGINLTLGFQILASTFKFQFTRRQAIAVCSLALLLSENAIWRELKYVQSDLLILTGFTLSLYWMDRKPYLAGICLGVIANIKYQSLFFLPFLLFRGRWKIAAGLIIGTIGTALLPALITGWHRNLEYLMIALRGIIKMPGSDHLAKTYAAQVPDIVWYANISLSSGLTRIFVAHGWSKSAALMVSLGIAIIIFMALWRMFKRRGIPFIWRTPQTLGNPQQEKIIFILEWSALLLCMLVFSPQCTSRHLILLLNMNMLAMTLIWFPPANGKCWPALTGLLIVEIMALANGLIAHPLHISWNHLGGPCWCLLIFLLLLTHNILIMRPIYHGRANPLDETAGHRLMG